MSKTILLADDSVTIQKVIELTFMDQDQRVVTVSSGDAALAKLEEEKPDFVIADVHMPGATGYDVAKRSKELFPEVPVLLLVGTFEPFDEAELTASGADQVLKKPFDSQELQRLVEELDSKGGSGTGAASPPPPPAAADSLDDSDPFAGLGDAPEERAAVGAGAGGDDLTAGLDDFSALSLERPAASEPEAEDDEYGDEDAFDLEDYADLAGPADEGPAEDPVAAMAEPAAPEPERAPFSLGDLDEEEEKPEPEAAIPSGGEPFSLGSLEDDADVQIDELEVAAEDEDGDDEGDETAQDGGFAFGAVPVDGTPEPPSQEELAAAEEDAAGDDDEDGDEPHASNGRLLSDEDIDRIAHRVAELVGERLVQQVAWDVIPDMAEVIIRERLEELESQVD